MPLQQCTSRVSLTLTVPMARGKSVFGPFCICLLAQADFRSWFYVTSYSHAYKLRTLSSAWKLKRYPKSLTWQVKTCLKGPYLSNMVFTSYFLCDPQMSKVLRFERNKLKRKIIRPIQNIWHPQTVCRIACDTGSMCVRRLGDSHRSALRSGIPSETTAPDDESPMRNRGTLLNTP